MMDKYGARMMQTGMQATKPTHYGRTAGRAARKAVRAAMRDFGAVRTALHGVDRGFGDESVEWWKNRNGDWQWIGP